MFKQSVAGVTVWSVSRQTHPAGWQKCVVYTAVIVEGGVESSGSMKDSWLVGSKQATGLQTTWLGESIYLRQCSSSAPRYPGNTKSQGRECFEFLKSSIQGSQPTLQYVVSVRIDCIDDAPKTTSSEHLHRRRPVYGQNHITQLFASPL